MCLPETFTTGYSAIDTLLSADDQAFLSDLENRLQVGMHLLNGICKHFGLQTSTLKTNEMGFRRTDIVRAKDVIAGTILGQVSKFEYLGCSLPYNTSNDVMNKLRRFNLICGTISSVQVKKHD